MLEVKKEKKVFSDYFTIDQKVNLNNSNKRIFSLFDVSKLDTNFLNNHLNKYNRKLDKYYKRNNSKKVILPYPSWYHN